ncbi:MAG: nucleotide-binding universal stress UspA family protein [Flavobacteriales bacterium]|jgi:nucleotide-binding universal stress UspA family protein
MKTILVPIDFSKYSENALKVAAKIANRNGSEIHLLHMLEIPSQMNDAVSSGAQIPEIILFINKAQEKLQELTQKEFLKGIKTVHHIKFEGTFNGIISYIAENKTDLIVMGSHGISGIEEMLLGSNTEKVIRLSEVPVLVIKKETLDFKGEHFVFASDFSEEIKKPFQKMLNFVEIFNAKLSLVMICTPNSFKTTALAEKIMNDFVSEFTIDNFSITIYNDSNIENGVINFSKKVQADLIGLSTHGRTGLAHFFTGSISEDLVNHTVRPVITFKI